MENILKHHHNISRIFLKNIILPASSVESKVGCCERKCLLGILAANAKQGVPAVNAKQGVPTANARQGALI
jgi:hypothetical protein